MSVRTYVCPECGKDNVLVHVKVPLVQHWLDGNLVKEEEENGFEQEPSDARCECFECGYEGEVEEFIGWIDHAERMQS